MNDEMHNKTQAEKVGLAFRFKFKYILLAQLYKSGSLEERSVRYRDISLLPNFPMC